jgi:hypothetical protein
MSLLHFYTPHIRDGNYKHTYLHWKGAAEQAKLCRDGVMIGEVMRRTESFYFWSEHLIPDDTVAIDYTV